MPLVFSESESRRFNLRIFRHKQLNPEQIGNFMNECVAQNADVIILRMPIEHAARVSSVLGSIAHMIPADQLIEFRKILNAKTIAEKLNSGSDIFELNPDNAMLLDGVVERSYETYINHYHANPCLHTERLLQGLDEFSRSFLGKPDKAVLLARYKGQICGYLCLEITGKTGSTVIGGSTLDIPAATRHKILCDLTHAGDHWLLARGAREFRATTRTDNTYIQKLLIRNMHCLPAGGIETIHFNLFLGKVRPETGLPPNKLEPAPTYTLRSPHAGISRRSYRITTDLIEYAYFTYVDELGIFATRYESKLRDLSGSQTTSSF